MTYDYCYHAISSSLIIDISCYRERCWILSIPGGTCKKNFVSRSCCPRLNYELLPISIWEEKESTAFDTLDSVIMTPRADFSHLPCTGFSPPRLRIESLWLYKHYCSCSYLLLKCLDFCWKNILFKRENERKWNEIFRLMILI